MINIDEYKTTDPEITEMEDDSERYRNLERYYERWLDNSIFSGEKGLFALLEGKELDLKTFDDGSVFLLCIVDGSGERLLDLGKVPFISPVSAKKVQDILFGGEVVGMILFDRFYGKENNKLRKRPMGGSFEEYMELLEKKQ